MRTFLLILLFVPTHAAAQLATPAAVQPTQVRRLTVDDAVRIALDNNLGIQVARIDPLIQDVAVAEARAAWDEPHASLAAASRLSRASPSHIPTS